MTSFDFGSVGPEVEIKDIRDVWRAFDSGDSDEEEEEFEMVADPRADYYGHENRDYGGQNGESGYGYDEAEDEDDDGGSLYSALSPRSVLDVGLGRNILTSPLLHPPPSSLLSSRPPSIPGLHPPPLSRKHRLPPSPSPPTSPSSDSLPSLQLHLHLSHSSDLHLTLLTSLQVNYPSPLFMSLPLKLCITGLTLSGDIILAYSKEKNRVHLCIVDEGDDPTGLGQRLLPNLQIESEIGHSDAHVLRNVGKVESFIAEVVRKTLVDELVFPNFHTIAL